MKKENNEYYEIDLLQLMRALLRRIWLIILVTVLVGGLAFSYAYFLVKPLYSSSVLMYVNNSSFSVGSTSFTFSSSELTAAQKLVDTYLVILKTRTTLEAVIEDADVDYSYEELSKMIEAGSVNNTEIFEITVTSESAKEARKLANTIAKVLPDTISDVVEGSDVRVVDYAVQDNQRVSPSYVKYTAIGMMLGFILICAYVIIQDLLDDIIRDEDYVLQNFKAPILASIPDLTQDKPGKYKSYSENTTTRGKKEA